MTIKNQLSVCKVCGMSLGPGRVRLIGMLMCDVCSAKEQAGRSYAENVMVSKPKQKTQPGEQPKQVGVKYDEGKPRWDLLMWKAAYAQVVVSTFGLTKYAENGWKTVPNAKARYTAALMRHLYAHNAGEKVDPQSGKPHLWHIHWNTGALIELDDEVMK